VTTEEDGAGSAVGVLRRAEDDRTEGANIMEEYRDDRQRRREVWYDENLVPGSTAASIALEATGADEDLVQSWLDFVTPHEGEWITYGQWVEGELSVSLEQGHGTLMPPNDWDQHHQWLSRMWNELAKATEEPHNQDGESATEVRMREERKARSELERRVHEKAQSMLLRPPARVVAVRVPGQVTCLLSQDDRGVFHVAGWTFEPSASSAGYFGPSAVLSDLDVPGEGDDDELHELRDSLEFGDCAGPFWVAVQEQLGNTQQISGEAAVVMEWVE
jgi:hypothetical protein